MKALKALLLRLRGGLPARHRLRSSKSMRPEDVLRSRANDQEYLAAELEHDAGTHRQAAEDCAKQAISIRGAAAELRAAADRLKQAGREAA